MSDNLPPEVVQEELEARFRIPTEVWTDVFKLLPRRVLVQQIAPVCYYFKEISDKNVKTIHVIEDAYQFTRKLKDDDPKAMKYLENLAANECQLAGQFKLSEIWIREKSQFTAILRHCPDLFKGCQITLDINGENKDSTLFLECLAKLEKAEPIKITIHRNEDQVIDYWHHPTFQNCNRICLVFWSGLSAATQMNVFDWLHQQPSGMDSDGSVTDQQVRSMIVWGWVTGQDHVDWLINRCSENIQQAQDPADRRSFVLSFCCWDWPGFGQFRRIENKSTGEVLLLERKMRANGEATHRYRLRRCLTEEEANGAVFYAEMFEQDYEEYEEFNIGDETPEVTII